MFATSTVSFILFLFWYYYFLEYKVKESSGDFLSSFFFSFSNGYWFFQYYLIPSFPADLKYYLYILDFNCEKPIPSTDWNFSTDSIFYKHKIYRGFGCLGGSVG